MQARSQFWLLAALLAAAAAGFVSFAAQSPRFPYALDYGEGTVLDAAWRIAEGRNIYPRAAVAPPYLVLSYPPLFMAALAPLTRWFGPAYWYGRILVLGSAVIAAVAVAMIGTHFAGRRAGAIAGLTFVSIPFVSGWAQLVRVDLPAIACAWSAMAALLWIRRESVALAVSIALMLAAGFTRQTVWIPACAAVAACLLAQRRLRALGTYVLALATTALIVGLALQRATGGFWFAVLASHPQPLRWTQWAAHAGEVLREMPLLIAITLVTVLVGLRRREPWAPLLVAYAIGTIPAIVTAANAGSNINYFLEPAAVCALAAGLAWGSLASASSGVVARWRLRLTVTLAVQAVWWIPINRPFRLTVPSYLDEAFALIRAERGPVLADSALGLLPIAGHHLWLEPFKMSVLAHAGSWNEQPLIDDLRAKRFALIVVMLLPEGPAAGQWTPAMWAAIEANYRRCRDIPIDTRVLALYRATCGGVRQ